MLTEERKKQLRSSPEYQSLLNDFKGEKLSVEPEKELRGSEAVKSLRASLIKNEEPQEEGVKGVAGFGVGVGKGIVSTLKGASSLGEKMIKGLGRIVTPKGLEEKLGFAKEEETSAEKIIPKDWTEAKGGAEKAGKFGEQVAEFLIPGTAALKAGKAISSIVKGGKISKGLVGLGATSFGEGILSGGQAAIQQGDLGKEALVAGATGMAIPSALKVGGQILKGAGKLGAEVLGKTTGAGKQSIIEAFNNPAVISLAKKAGVDMPTFQDDMLTSLKSGLNEIKETRGAVYKKQLENLKLQPKEYENVISDVRDVAKSGLDNFDLSIKPQSDEITGKVLNNIDFSKSTMRVNDTEKRIVQEAYNDLMSWTDDTAAGLDNLKKVMYKWKDKLPLEAKEGKILIGKLAEGLDKTIKQNVKGYKEMTGSYKKASDMIDEIDEAFKPGGNKETAIKKIMSSLRENNETRKELLDLVGGKELLAKVAGSQLSSLTPKGLTGAITGGGLGAGGVLAILNPSTWPALLSLAAITSPRLMGNLATILGKIDRKMIDSGLPLQLAKEFRAVIQEIYNK